MNYYELLGVSENATTDEIKSAYKKQMKLWHPDINKSNDAIDMSKKLNNAKEVLLDDDKRKEYDLYLKDKIEDNYNKYTSKPKNDVNYETYEDTPVTKWQYLKDWLRFAKVPKLRKIIGILGAAIESLICLIIRILIIILSFVLNALSIVIRSIYAFLSPFFGIILLILVAIMMVNGIGKTINDYKDLFKGIVLLIIIYVISYLLPLLSDALISPTTFDFVYNKIDITLFKICVGYKNN